MRLSFRYILKKHVAHIKNSDIKMENNFWSKNVSLLVFILFALVFSQTKDTANHTNNSLQIQRINDLQKNSKDTSALKLKPDIGYDSTPKAVLKGIKLSSELIKGTKDEFIVTCRFIFQNKPLSYFYFCKLKRKNKYLIFEFNGATLDTSKIQSSKELNINGFEILDVSADRNKVLKNKPGDEEQADLRVTFFLEEIPFIKVTDQGNEIGFSYKWTTHPRKINKFISINDDRRYWLYVLGISFWTIIVIAGAYFIIKH